MKSLRIEAPAKVNLFLRAATLRADGYHELDTLFEALSFGDVLEFRARRDKAVRLSCTLKSLPTGPKNLVVRAALLLRKETSVSAGVDIRLTKNLPVASGLGGGSSDAASTLLGLNRFWKLGLSQANLLKLAAELGSDVPFFILQTPFASAKGRGEILTPWQSKSKFWHVLVTPRLHVLAKDVYRALTNEDRAAQPATGDALKMKTGVIKGDIADVGSRMFNTLERVLVRDYAVIRKLLADLTAAGAVRSMVSGSGPTVLGLASSKANALRIARVMRRKHPAKFIQPVSTSA